MANSKYYSRTLKPFVNLCVLMMLASVVAFQNNTGKPCLSPDLKKTFHGLRVNWVGMETLRMICETGYDTPIGFTNVTCKASENAWDKDYMADCNKKVLPDNVTIQFKPLYPRRLFVPYFAYQDFGLCDKNIIQCKEIVDQAAFQKIRNGKPKESFRIPTTILAKPNIIKTIVLFENVLLLICEKKLKPFKITKNDLETTMHCPHNYTFTENACRGCAAGHYLKFNVCLECPKGTYLPDPPGIKCRKCPNQRTDCHELNEIEGP